MTRTGSLYSRWVLGGALLGLACGPTIENVTGDGSGTSGEDASASASADETGSPGRACGESDTELVGGGPPGALGYPLGCAPNSDPGINGYRCCSTDPAAVGGAPPNYQHKNIPNSDTPYFSGDNNDLSAFGQCIRVGDLAGQGLIEMAATNCPIPCNPTWPEDIIDDVCGLARVCCQVRELEPEDCIIDPNTGLYRPVDGDDIGVSTVWRPSDHATHQDVNGSTCLALAGGDASSPVFQDCIRQLSVADQRGFCMSLNAGQSCPADQPTYINACDLLNGG